MDVTFLIGNGFDLACGLNTSYASFIGHYCRLPSKNENIVRFKNEILRNEDSWANAECAFGQYTRNFGFDEAGKFLECLDDFINEMGKYLVVQETSLKDLIFEKEGMDRFKKGLLQFYDFLPENSMKIVKAVLDSVNGKSRIINAIVFNYTNVFENFVAKLCEPYMNYIGPSVASSGSDAANHLGNVVYAHGKLNKSSLIFGVDNEEQVFNKQLLQTNDVAYSIIKPEATSDQLVESQRKCFELIAGSTFICIFGMSIGITDMTWWKKISDWLKEDPNHHLVQYARDETCIRNSPGSYKRTQISYRQYINDRLLLSEEQGKQLSNQIHLEFNRDLFGVEDTVNLRSNTLNSLE